MPEPHLHRRVAGLIVDDAFGIDLCAIVELPVLEGNDVAVRIDHAVEMPAEHAPVVLYATAAGTPELQRHTVPASRQPAIIHTPETEEIGLVFETPVTLRYRDQLLLAAVDDRVELVVVVYLAVLVVVDVIAIGP